ncbi:MAG: hypothetical protein HXY34_05510 [Candidatus Thorarchaeota archaeon]|nr:hypothetical protein [Candidatus Thorarchaeota archaeon]
MDLGVAFIVSGVLVLVRTAIRGRGLVQLEKHGDRIRQYYDVSSLDPSAQGVPSECYSHKWAMENISSDRPTHLRLFFEDILNTRTLAAFLVIALVMSSAAVILTLLLVESIALFGGAVAVFAMTFLVILGPSGPRISEKYLEDLGKADWRSLCAHDYLYFKIAVDSVRQWTARSAIIGITFILLAPWAQEVPTLVAHCISTLIVYLVLYPALTLAGWSLALAMVYIGLVIVLAFYIIPRAVWTRFSGGRSEEEEMASGMRW